MNFGIQSNFENTIAHKNEKREKGTLYLSISKT